MIIESIDYKRIKEVIHNSDPIGFPADDTHTPACVFLLLFNRPDPHILAIQKSDTEGYPWRNQVALPGGHMENADTSPVATAFRELEEELNISKDQVDFIGSLGHFQTLTRPKDIEAFVGYWGGKGPVRFDPNEIARVLEIPLSTLIKTHQVKNYHLTTPDIRELEYPFKDIIIWGATARILYHFIELIYPLIVGRDDSGPEPIARC
ncbi:MAG: CoA pyrophosphatase [Desulfobacterales bacterium]|jgi:8-oxo-dGTP pyrophosphatase MutT (NUDIX family)